MYEATHNGHSTDFLMKEYGFSRLELLLKAIRSGICPRQRRIYRVGSDGVREAYQQNVYTLDEVKRIIADDVAY